jgi:hypothetical protein
MLLLLTPLLASAHPTNIDFSQMPRTQVAWSYLRMGFIHILPLGYDHILFITSLLLLSTGWRQVIMQTTAFTIAHSITLALAMYRIIEPSPAIIEPVIALSIAFVAAENIIIRRVHPLRLLIVFFFGLIHGMGFAGVLIEQGLPEKQFITAIFAFNAGVELGQIAIILLAFLLVGNWAGDNPRYLNRLAVPASVCILLVATYWTIERTMQSLNP